jgi:hypothetical protein
MKLSLSFDLVLGVTTMADIKCTLGSVFLRRVGGLR